jgi:hypothetical protein
MIENITDYPGLIVSIHHDDSASDWDDIRPEPLGTFEPRPDPREWSTKFDEWHEEIETEYPGAIIVPRYDGDGARDGLYVLTPDEIRREWSCQRISAKTRAQATASLQAQADEYHEWARGHVYGYVIEDDEGNHLDSCWGFIGWEWVQEAAKEEAEYHAAEISKQRADAVAEIEGAASLDVLFAAD